jgi:probable DNA repair protein
MGEPLGGQPLVAHGLLALDLLLGEQPLAAIGQLLRSPFIGGHSAEWEARALFDVFLREDGLPRLDIDRLLRRLAAVDPAHPAHCPDLAARMAAFAGLRQGMRAQAAPDRWAAALQQALAALGWPGDRPLDSVEFQQHRRLQDLLSELAAVAKVRPRMRLAEAVGHLRTLAAETLFQAESAAVPIRILGPLEAAGLQFDALWLLGMHDQNWPPPAQPDPLLPVGLQRELGMPHASAARELAFAAALTARLAGAAAEVIASHARFDGEREQRPSPLLQDWEQVAPEDLLRPGTQLLAACAANDRCEALPAPAAGAAAARQRGGAGLLAAQARCPFQAVARYRLRAGALPEPTHAADAALLGDLVHELLQRTWQALGDSAALHRADDSVLAEQIARLADAVLQDLGRRRPDLFGATFRALERERLTALVVDWLRLERTRPGEFRVEALEQRQPVELDGLELSTRVDRIDRLGDGSLVVIDYKTGREVSSAGWLDERLSEPQLPLYCVHAGDAVAAAVLARVRRDDKGCSFVGLGREPGLLPGAQDPADIEAGPSWESLGRQWRERLGILAREVLDGRADPTPSPQACRHCDLGSLCRVQELLAEDSGDD